MNYIKQAWDYCAECATATWDWCCGTAKSVRKLSFHKVFVAAPKAAWAYVKETTGPILRTVGDGIINAGLFVCATIVGVVIALIMVPYAAGFEMGLPLGQHLPEIHAKGKEAAKVAYNTIETEVAIVEDVTLPEVTEKKATRSRVRLAKSKMVPTSLRALHEGMKSGKIKVDA